MAGGVPPVSSSSPHETNKNPFPDLQTNILTKPISDPKLICQFSEFGQLEKDEIPSLPPLKEPTETSFAEVVKGSKGSTKASTAPRDCPQVLQGQSVNQPFVDTDLITFQPISSHQGKPAVTFPFAEKRSLIDNVKNVLVGKFSHGHPPLSSIKAFFAGLHLVNVPNISFFDKKHIFIQCSCKLDFIKLWLQLEWNVNGYSMRMLKWIPDFKPTFEPAIVPVWVRFENLPLYMFDEMSLLKIANSIGKPIKVDPRNVNRTILHSARVCIELDVGQPLFDSIWVRFVDEASLVTDSFCVNVCYDVLPSYCSFCLHIGHELEACKRKPQKLSHAVGFAVSKVCGLEANRQSGGVTSDMNSAGHGLTGTDNVADGHKVVVNVHAVKAADPEIQQVEGTDEHLKPQNGSNLNSKTCGVEEISQWSGSDLQKGSHHNGSRNQVEQLTCKGLHSGAPTLTFHNSFDALGQSEDTRLGPQQAPLLDDESQVKETTNIAGTLEAGEVELVAHTSQLREDQPIKDLREQISEATAEQENDTRMQVNEPKVLWSDMVEQDDQLQQHAVTGKAQHSPVAVLPSGKEDFDSPHLKGSVVDCKAANCQKALITGTKDNSNDLSKPKSSTTLLKTSNLEQSKDGAYPAVTQQQKEFGQKKKNEGIPLRRQQPKRAAKQDRAQEVNTKPQRNDQTQCFTPPAKFLDNSVTLEQIEEMSNGARKRLAELEQKSRIHKLSQVDLMEQTIYEALADGDLGRTEDLFTTYENQIRSFDDKG